MSAAAPSLLSIRSLSVDYGAMPVLHDVDIEIPAGAFVAVVGANTAGKSTLLRAVSGLLGSLGGKASGRIDLLGQDLLATPAHRIPALGIAHVPEGRHVFPDMSVTENLLLGAYAYRADRARVAESLEQMFEMFPRLRERRRQSAGTLSGGEQQMVAIGRAMMSRPRLLLLDEPSHGLAPRVVAELHKTLIAIHRSGVTILLVEQNTRLALSTTELAYVLQSGKVVLSGASRELLDDGRVREAYLGI